MATPLGTQKREFRKNWIYLNPNSLVGPGTWDVASMPMSPDGCVDRILAVLPLISEQSGTNTVLKFSIVGLTPFNRTSGSINPLTEARQLSSSSSTGPYPRALCIKKVKGEVPIQSLKNDDRYTLLFSIHSLPEMSEISGWSANGGLPYNVTRSLVGVTADEPVVSQLNGEEINVSFNINLLPDI